MYGVAFAAPQTAVRAIPIQMSTFHSHLENKYCSTLLLLVHLQIQVALPQPQMLTWWPSARSGLGSALHLVEVGSPYRTIPWLAIVWITVSSRLPSLHPTGYTLEP